MFTHFINGERYLERGGERCVLEAMVEPYWKKSGYLNKVGADWPSWWQMISFGEHDQSRK